MRTLQLLLLCVGAVTAINVYTTPTPEFLQPQGAQKVCCSNACTGCCHSEGDFCPTRLLNVSRGKLVPGIGARGPGAECLKWFQPGCNVLPRQLAEPLDFAVDPSGRWLFVVDVGMEADWMQVSADGRFGASKQRGNAPELGDRLGSNSTRLIRFDLHNTSNEPVTLSYCGMFKEVEFDAARNQLLVLRISVWETQFHGTTGGSEVLRFKDPINAAAADASVPCQTGFDTNPSLNGLTIARAGLGHDMQPASTMFLLGNSSTAHDTVLVGDQVKFCVLAYPLDGSYGSTTPGDPVVGTCGKGTEVGVPVDTQGKAGHVLSNSQYNLEYVMYPGPKSPGGNLNPHGRGSTLPDTLFLHDQNHGTIDCGSSPKAKTDFPMVPIESQSSSLYFNALWDHRHCTEPDCEGLLIMRDGMSNGITRAKRGKNGGFHGGERIFELSDFEAQESDQHGQVQVFQGLPMRWRWLPNGKLLTLVAYSAKDYASAKQDAAFLELDVPVHK